jgi:hypothetical protein
MKSYILILYILLSNISLVLGHSAVACTDISKGECKGYPRYYYFNHLDQQLPSSDLNDTFYASRDRETLIQAGINKICPEMTITEYTSQFPMAEAYPGQNLTIQHPPRGHSQQPSSPVWIYMHPIANIYPNNKQPNSSEFKLISEYSFDNCYGVEKEISWANCTGTFKIPENTSPGVYTFWWRWDLNSIPYSDCFEINVKPSNYTKQTTRRTRSERKLYKNLLN